jgi:hypothetical protein
MYASLALPTACADITACKWCSWGNVSEIEQKGARPNPEVVIGATRRSREILPRRRDEGEQIKRCGDWE